MVTLTLLRLQISRPLKHIDLSSHSAGTLSFEDNLELKPYYPFLTFISSFTALQLSIYPPSEAGNGGEGTVPYIVYTIHYIELCIQ